MNIIPTDRLTAFFRPFQKAAVYGALSNPFADGFCEGLKESQVATLTETLFPLNDMQLYDPSVPVSTH